MLVCPQPPEEPLVVVIVLPLTDKPLPVAPVCPLTEETLENGLIRSLNMVPNGLAHTQTEALLENVLVPSLPEETLENVFVVATFPPGDFRRDLMEKPLESVLLSPLVELLLDQFAVLDSFPLMSLSTLPLSLGEAFPPPSACGGNLPYPHSVTGFAIWHVVGGP